MAITASDIITRREIVFAALRTSALRNSFI